MESTRVATIVIYVEPDGLLRAYVDGYRARRCQIGDTSTLHALLALVEDHLASTKAAERASERGVARTDVESAVAHYVATASPDQLRDLLRAVRAENDQTGALKGPVKA